MRFASTGSPDACCSCRQPETPAPAASDQRADTSSRSNASSGFSLIEVLAAMVILALGLSALYSSFSTALRAANHADGHLAAVQLAQSVLDQQTGGRVFKPGLTRGRQDQYQWALLVEPADEELAPASGSGTWQLQRLVVTVTWPRQRRLELETLHLARTQ